MCQETYPRYECETCTLLSLSSEPSSKTKCPVAPGDFGSCARREQPIDSATIEPELQSDEHRPAAPDTQNTPTTSASSTAPTVATKDGISKLYADQPIPKCQRCVDEDKRDAVQITGSWKRRGPPSPSDMEWNAYVRNYWKWSKENQGFYHVDSDTGEVVEYPEHFD
ncbi:hypothetical protein MKZ38_010461 [Zalerion maritima]|uniref:Uncharacterized protein n=1 Tax=Zalerion maritima TaxID=339359 RepID=A0AAD5RFX4_9PEZI|nr:hypothetical protein MKZ38_010461 [Zalerion maritima]